MGEGRNGELEFNVYQVSVLQDDRVLGIGCKQYEYVVDPEQQWFELRSSAYMQIFVSKYTVSPLCP